ncbi:DUF2188 domain-containing protein [Cupriavidus sp. CP313]
MLNDQSDWGSLRGRHSTRRLPGSPAKYFRGSRRDLVPDPVNNCPRFSVYSPGIDWDPIITRYEQYYGALDPRRSLVARAPAGTLVCCQDHISERDVAQSEFYQDYQIPTAGLRYLMGTRLTRPGSSETLLGLLRAAGRRPYSDEERETAASLIPHLHRAINLWQDAKALHRDAALGTELMEQLDLAIFALDKEGRVVFSNQAGEALLSAGTALRLRHGALEVGSLPKWLHRFPTLEAAIAAGWVLARRENAELHIQRHDGSVRLCAASGDKQELLA